MAPDRAVRYSSVLGRGTIWFAHTGPATRWLGRAFDRRVDYRRVGAISCATHHVRDTRHSVVALPRLASRPAVDAHPTARMIYSRLSSNQAMQRTATRCAITFSHDQDTSTSIGARSR